MSTLHRFLIKRALLDTQDIDNPYDPFDNLELYKLFNEAHENIMDEYKTTGLNPVGYWLADKGGSTAGRVAGALDRGWAGLKRIGTGIRNGARYSGNAARDALDWAGNRVQGSPITFLLGAGTVGALGNRAGDALAKLLKWKNNGFGANALRWIGTVGGGAIGGLGAAAVAHRFKQRRSGHNPHDMPNMSDLGNLNAKDFDRDTSTFD